MTEFRQQLIDAATAPYRSAGRFAWHFARGKVSGDPVFVSLLKMGAIPDGVALLDLGCGQGLLASWLLAARRLHAQGIWPAGWQAPPAVSRVRGIELMARDVERARRALGDQAEFVHGNICDAEFGQVGAVVILDVLHYIDYAAQEEVLRRVVAALPVGGTLLLRVGDAAGGWRFRYSQWVDRAATLARGHGLITLYCRPLAEWQTLLRKLGFSVSAVPMSDHTLFANVLLMARLERK